MLDVIRVYCEVHKMSPSAFGEKFFGNRSFVGRIKAGKFFVFDTMGKVRPLEQELIRSLGRERFEELISKTAAPRTNKAGFRRSPGADQAKIDLEKTRKCWGF